MTSGTSSRAVYMDGSWWIYGCMDLQVSKYMDWWWFMYEFGVMHSWIYGRMYLYVYIIYIFIYGFVYLMDVWYIRIVHLVCRYAHKFKGRQVWYSQRNQCNCHVDRTWPWACRTCPKGWTPAQSHRRWPSRDKILASKKNIYIYIHIQDPQTVIDVLVLF